MPLHSYVAQRAMLKTGGGAVMLTPDVGQGYLVLNKKDHPDVADWVIELNQRTFAGDGTYIDQALDKVTLSNDINFWRVPEKFLYSADVFSINIYGLDENSDPVISEGPTLISNYPETALGGNDTPFALGCKWRCNGSYYAWDIQQFTDPNQPTIGPSYLELKTALNFNEATQVSTPIYRYITQEQYYDPIVGCGGSEAFYLYDVPCVDLTGIWMTDPIAVPQGSSAYKDLNGNVIPGPATVRGVGKPLGDWSGGQPIITPELQFGTNMCTQPTTWAMDHINNSGPHPLDGTGTGYHPPLTCDQLVSGGVTDPTPHVFGEITWKSGLINKWLASGNNQGTGGDTWNPFVNELVSIVTGSSINSGQSWQELIDMCIITDLNNTDNAVISINRDDAQTFTNGFSLAPGLYNFGFAIKDFGYVPVIFEIEEKLSVSMAQSDFLSVILFPVPIEDNKFNIEMTAQESLNFNYEFRDSNGQLLYEQKFSLKKGQQWKHTVAPKLGIPTGTHINRFVFEDGSVLSLQTIK